MGAIRRMLESTRARQQHADLCAAMGVRTRCLEQRRSGASRNDSPTHHLPGRTRPADRTSSNLFNTPFCGKLCQKKRSSKCKRLVHKPSTSSLTRFRNRPVKAQRLVRRPTTLGNQSDFRIAIASMDTQVPTTKPCITMNQCLILTKFQPPDVTQFLQLMMNNIVEPLEREFDQCSQCPLFEYLHDQ